MEEQKKDNADLQFIIQVQTTAFGQIKTHQKYTKSTKTWT